MSIRAESLYNLIDQDPGRAERAAVALAAEASAAGDLAGEALAWRAAAVAARGRDVSVARDLATRGHVVARDAGLVDTADRISVTLAGIDVFAGKHGEARKALAAVSGRRRGVARWEALTQLGFLHLLAGEYDDAMACFDRSIDHLDPEGVWAANTISNRGLARAYVGDLAEAQQDLTAAAKVFDGLGAVLAVADVHQNLGWVMDQAGDYVGALRSFNAADTVLADTPASRGYLLRDRANTLLAVGLVGEAVDDAEASAQAFESAGRDGDATESRTVQALALALLGQRSEAVAIATSARNAFREQRRPIHADHAALIALRAIDASEASRGRAAEARRVAARLEKQGSLNVGLDARLTAARLAMWSGDLRSAAADLEAARRCRRSPRHDLRLSYWGLAAELAAREGRGTGALRAARRGLEVLDESQRTLGSTEARVNVSVSAREIGAVALRIAHERGPATTFDWMERVRAGALRYRPVRPEGDQELAVARAQLRSLAREIDEGQLDGRDVSDLVQRQAQIERDLRFRLLEARGGEQGTARASAADVRARLEGAVLVAFASIDGRLFAVRLDERRSRLVELGPLDEIAHEVDHLRFASIRLSTGRMSTSSLETLRAGAERLDRLLIRPVDRSDRPIVVVPMGAMFTVPWGLLPSVAGRPLTLAPSASMWIAAASRPAAKGNRVLAAGPDLSHARREVELVARIHRDAVVLEGERATSSNLLDAVDGAELFHIASHGVFRSDNPLFSHLRLSDGPLAVHELETLHRAPGTVVLSSCDVGLTQPRPGNEWLGMATALLSLGTRSIVASVMPVPDAEATVSLMQSMHHRIAQGSSVTHALQSATAGLADDDLPSLAAKAAFVCIGA